MNMDKRVFGFFTIIFIMTLSSCGFFGNLEDLQQQAANPTWTVSFVDSLGDETFPSVNVVRGGKVKKPADPLKTDCSFDGWYRDAECTELWDFETGVVTEDLILYAGWWLRVTYGSNPVTSLQDKLNWLTFNAKNGARYSIEIDDAQDIGSFSLSYDDINVITIRLKGLGDSIYVNRDFSSASTAAMFRVGSGVTFILENIVLNGSDKDSLVVQIETDGALEMRSGSIITCVSANPCGGVFVNGGSFTMNGGTITGNKADNGGGVRVKNGIFTMNAGEISGNTVVGSDYGIGYGGGVHVDDYGAFIMNGGLIQENEAQNGGGGVSVFMRDYAYSNNLRFIMNGGEIRGNKSYSGGGVYLMSGTAALNESGKIYNNLGVFGGGVCVAGGIFTMNAGEIYENAANNGYGGGVSVDGGTFILNSGEIRGNTAYVGGRGGGVSVYGNYSFFIMNDGKITENGFGFTTYNDIQYYETMSGGGVRLDAYAIFTMNGGEISGNVSRWKGGGVLIDYVYGAAFNMKGGTIFNNMTGGSYTGEGGGICAELGIVRISGGTIYGSDAPEGFANAVYESEGNGTGAALCVYGDAEAQYGNFDANDDWTSNGDLDTTDDTIEVVNGELK